ncbi:DNA polymerase Y family protein [Kitasatospora indigofera]|uniref:DNA polymerase Y family protein n=1 Tax=Kitasatospora indigofera TaxID=67307 RepID=UPI0036965221
MNRPGPRAILQLRFAEPSFETYRELFGVLADVSPVVQALPPDAALIDITGALKFFRRTPQGMADLLQTRLVARYGIQAAIGGGSTRQLAAMACDTCRPGQIRVLDPEDPPAAAAFLRSRPVEALPGVGPVLTRALLRYGVRYVGDLADLPLATLQRIAGASTGRLLHDRAHGHDPRPVATGGPPASITGTRAFDRDVLDPDQVRRALLDLAGDLGHRLRTSAQTCRRVELQVTFADRSHTTRSRTLKEPTSHSPALTEALYAMFASLGLQRARIRAVTARLGHLAAAEHGYVQLTLDAVTEDRRRLEPVLDKAARRFGTGAVRPAALAAPSPYRPGQPRRFG